MKLYESHPCGREIRLDEGSPSRLRAAIETCALAILGIPAQARNGAKGLHHLRADLEGRLLNIPDDATLTCKEHSGRRLFTVASSAISEQGCADILNALDETAKIAHEDYQNSLSVVNSLMHIESLQLIVVATRQDCAEDLDIDLTKAIKRSCQGVVRFTDVLLLNHVKNVPSADWPRMLENQDAAYRQETRRDQPMTDLVDAMTRIIHDAGPIGVEPDGVEPDMGRVEENRIARGFTQHAGWSAAQMVPFVVLAAVCGSIFLGGALWQWAGAGLFSIAAVLGFALTLQQHSKEWLYTSTGQQARLTIGDKEIRQDDCTLWQSPLAKVFDVCRLRTPHQNYLMTNAQRLFVAMGKAPSESRVRLVLDAAVVISLATSAAIVVRGFVL